MAYSLTVDVIDPDGEIYVTHTFWGETEKEVRQHFDTHQKACEYFSAAVNDDRVMEELEEISDDELPTTEDEEGDD